MNLNDEEHQLKMKLGRECPIKRPTKEMHGVELVYGRVKVYEIADIVGISTEWIRNIYMKKLYWR